MKGSIKLLGAGGLAVTLLIAGCSSSKSSNSATTAAAASATGTGSGANLPVSGNVKVGIVYEGGGALQAASISFDHGIQVAVDQANAAGGVVVNGKRYNLQLDSCNDNGDQTQATGCADKLVLDNGDKFMFGGLADFGPIVRGVTEANQTIYFSSGTAVAALMSSSKYVVDVTPADPVRFSTDVAAIKKAFPDAKTVGFIGDQSQTWTKDVAGIKPLLKSAGINDVDEETVPLDVSDFTPLLTKMKNTKPDVIVSYMSSAARSQVLLKENQTLQVSKGFMDPSASCESIAIGSNPGVTVVGNTNTGAILSGSGVTPLAQKYLTNFYANGWSPNPDPNVSLPLYAYDAVGWLVAAMEKAGTTSDTKSILTAMNSLPYEGINGKLTMASNQETYGQVFCNSTDGSSTYDEYLLEP